MKALWLDKQILSYRTEVPMPSVPKGESLIAVRLAGICSTDLEMVKGYYPYSGIPGHEFVGEVVSSDSNPELVGKRVVGEINAVCGECPHCRSGRPTHCSFRTVLGISSRNGVFAEFASLPTKNLHIVPDGLSDQQAVFTEPLAAALEILEQSPVHPNERVLLVGAGRLGQLIARVLALTGCQLDVIVRSERAKDLLAGTGSRPVDALSTNLGGYDLVIDATGSPEGFSIAANAVRARGRIVLKSTFAGSMQINLSPLVVNEVTIIGSRCGPFRPALDLMARGLVDPSPLIEQTYALSDGVEAFDQAARQGVFKVFLSP